MPGANLSKLTWEIIPGRPARCIAIPFETRARSFLTDSPSSSPFLPSFPSFYQKNVNSDIFFLYSSREISLKTCSKESFLSLSLSPFTPLHSSITGDWQ